MEALASSKKALERVGEREGEEVRGWEGSQKERVRRRKHSVLEFGGLHAWRLGGSKDFIFKELEA